MTLPHENATARITIDGLAVCCFNKSANKWEVGYLRHPNEPLHQLILHIENQVAIEIPQTAREITISATNPLPVPGGAPDGFFDPRGIRPNRHSFPVNASELEDFRWIVDLQDPTDINHGNARLKRPMFPVTRAFIHNAVLYSRRLAPRPVFRIPFTNLPQHDPNEMNENTRQQFSFGRTNNETAADIFCAPDTGKVTVTIPNVLPQPIDLPHRPGNPWKVRLTNLCPRTGGGEATFEIGDFQLFYDVLEVTGQKQAIWGQPVASPAFVDTGRVDCDTTWVSASQTLDEMMPA
ncbi:MAG TPA: hypothetical protein VJU84_03815 [Pyrinomonadaceae bacterium]|nr:hypothetical protein [Pyrinomonadaceae bacterium]